MKTMWYIAKKDLLQTLAVLGKEFTLRHLKAMVARSDSELERMLADLQMAEFIYEQPSMGDVEFTFKHALTQEVGHFRLITLFVHYSSVGGCIPCAMARCCHSHSRVGAHGRLRGVRRPKQ